ncbi:MAG TPA: tetratricopeptide repeat protein [Clostridia bacterium]|nr:tetratricopeptide repeat protein [Clostridia bacterium]
MRRPILIVAVLAVAVLAPPYLPAQQTGRTVRKSRVAVEEHPADIQKAQAAIEQRDLASAEALLQEALKQDPQNYQAHFYLGYVYSNTNRRPEAIAAYRKSVAARPNLFESNLNLGMLLAADASPEASKYLKAATQLKPSGKQDEALARAWMSLGRVLESADRAGAVDAYQRAAELQPRNPAPHLELGQMLERHSDLAGAEKEYKVALTLDANSADPLASLANLYMRGKRLPEAESTIRELLKTQPGNANARVQLGRILAAQNKQDEAAAELEAALQLAPTDGDALRELASIQMKQKKFEAAAASYGTLVAKSPKDPDLRYALGSALMRVNKYPEAQQEFLTTIKLKPEWGEAYGELAVAASGNKDYNLTIRALDARAKILPEMAGTYFLRAVAYDHLGAVKEASDNYKQFLGVANGQFPDQEWQARHRLIAIDPSRKK